MTLLPFLILTFGAGFGAWFGRAWPRAAAAVGLIGLLAALALTVALPDQVEAVVGGEAVAEGPTSGCSSPRPASPESSSRC